MKKFRIKRIRKGIITLALSCTLISTAITSLTSHLNNKKSENNNSAHFEFYIDESMIEPKKETVYDILDNNKYLDEEKKELEREFIEKIEKDFDLTIFKKNLEDLMIFCLSEESWQKKELADAAGFCYFKSKKIYCRNDYWSLSHENFHFVNMYYDDNTGKSMIFSDLENNNKGTIFNEYMTAYYNYKYFGKTSGYKFEYAFKMVNLLGEDRIKYLYEKGTVKDFIYYLYKDCRISNGNELVELIDKSNYYNNTEENKEEYDEEYENNIFKLESLLIDYDFTIYQNRLEECLSQFNDCSLEDKKWAIEMLLKTLYVGYSNYNDKSKEYFKNKLDNNIELQYSIITKYGIFENKKEYKELVNKVYKEYQNSKKDDYLTTSYLYEDVIKTLKEHGIIGDYKVTIKRDYDENLSEYEKVKNDVDTLDSVYEILKDNKRLNKQCKEYIMNFVNTLDGDFDLTIFKANLKNLRIDIMDEEEYYNSYDSKCGVYSIKNSYIIVPENELSEEYIYAALILFLRAYYDGNFYVEDYEYATTKCFGIGLFFKLYCYYYDMYFSNGIKFRLTNKIGLKLTNILGSERIKYYFEQGTVLDTVDDLASIYGDKKTAIHLINMMDENLTYENTDKEKYEKNVKEINALLDQYLEAKKEKEKNQISLPNYFTKDVEEIVSILNETANCEEEYKKEVFSKLLDVLYTKYYNRQYDSRLLDNDFNNALATIYVECSNLGIYSDSYGFLEFIGKTNYLCKCDRKTFLSYEQIRNNVRKKMSSNYILDVEDIFTRNLVK